VARLFGDGHAFAGEHGFVNGGRPGNDHAVRGDLFAGTDQKEISPDDTFYGYVPFLAVADDPGGLGPEFHEPLDGRRGLPPGPGLEQAAQDDEGDDEGGAVVIDVGHDACRREQRRGEGGQGGIGIGAEGPDGNQAVHIRGSLPGGLDGPGKEAAAHPEDDGGCEDEHGDEQRRPGQGGQEGEPVLHGTEEYHDA